MTIKATDRVTTTHHAVEEEIYEAWIAGYCAAERDIAERVAELETTWRGAGQISRNERIARDIAAMEACAAVARQRLRERAERTRRWDQTLMARAGAP